MSSEFSTVDLIARGHRAIADWESGWPAFEVDETLHVSEADALQVIDTLCHRLQHNYPFAHPSYAGQMLKPPHDVAAAAYAIAQRINPNNHALDGGPATSEMERECTAQLASLFGFDPESSLGHLTSSGTIANLEALWIARELHPDKSIAYSSQSHYTHERMCALLRVEGQQIHVDIRGRIDLDYLESMLKTGAIGTVVATAGTTSLGAVDPVHEIVPLAAKYGARVHVDAAYGGFFRVLAESRGEPGDLARPAADAFKAISESDSIVIDPHKHGLQPYGCGAILFRDAVVGSIYKHDSPYTYVTSDELHLGEISLECSRAGAAAAALWATLQAFPLKRNLGFGPILRKCRAAAQIWADLIDNDDQLRLVLHPELDLIAFFPAPQGDGLVSRISDRTSKMFMGLMNDPADPMYLATLKLPKSLVSDSELEWDQEHLTVFRSVLMKPEHLAAVPRLHERVLKIATQH